MSRLIRIGELSCTGGVPNFLSSRLAQNLWLKSLKLIKEYYRTFYPKVKYFTSRTSDYYIVYSYIHPHFPLLNSLILTKGNGSECG